MAELGWTDLFSIHMSVRAFARRGWALAVFQHERLHFDLSRFTTFGIAERELGLLLLGSRLAGAEALAEQLGTTYEAATASTWQTQEGIGVLIQLAGVDSTARDRMQRDLDPRAVQTAYVIDKMLALKAVPIGRRGTLAAALAMIAHGGPVLERLSRLEISFDEVRQELVSLSPDVGLPWLVQEFDGLSPKVVHEWLDDYSRGERPQDLTKFAASLGATLLSHEEAVIAALSFHQRFTRAIYPAALALGVKRAQFEHIAGAVAQQVDTSYLAPPEAEAYVRLVPAGITDPAFHHVRDLSAKTWAEAEIVTLVANFQSASIPRYSSSVLTGQALAPGHVQITAFTSGQPDAHRLTARTSDRLKTRLKALRSEQRIFVAFDCRAPHEWEEQSEPPLLAGLRYWLLHVGEWLAIQQWLAVRAALGKRTVMRNYLSRIGRVHYSSHVSAVMTSEATIGQFGYVVFGDTTSNRLLVWPTPMFVATKYLGSSSQRDALGVDLLEPITEPMTQSESEPQWFDNVAFQAFTRTFEAMEPW